MNNKMFFLMIFFLLVGVVFLNACDQEAIGRKIVNKDISSVPSGVDEGNFEEFDDEEMFWEREELEEEFLPTEEEFQEMLLFMNPPSRDDGVIDECGTIINDDYLEENDIEQNEEGMYVITLEGDLDCSSDEFREQEIPAILIGSNDVLLNGNNHMLIGPWNGEMEELNWRIDGVSALVVENIIIRNFNIRRFEEGISLWRGGNSIILERNNVNENKYSGIHVGRINLSIIRDNTANNNNKGISMYDVHDNTIENNIINNNRDGIHTRRFYGGVIKSNIVNNNQMWGMDLTHFKNSIIEDNTVNNNDKGIIIVSFNDSELRGNVVENSEQTGIGIHAAYNNILTNNIVNNNGNGISIEIFYNNIMESNTANNNYMGINVHDAYNNTLINNRLNNNRRAGIYLSDNLEGNEFVLNNFCFSEFLDIYCGRNLNDLNNFFEGNRYESLDCDMEIEEGLSCNFFDLAIEEVIIEPPLTRNNARVGMMILIRNEGQEASPGDVSIRIRYGDGEMAISTIGSIQPGESLSKSLLRHTYPVGEEHIGFIYDVGIDYNNEVEDDNMDNNVYEGVVRIEGV